MNKRKSARYIRIIGIVISVIFLAMIVNEVYTTINLKYNISLAESENQELKKESEKLQNEVKKLKDENYIQTYVSGTIFSTEKGTSIYVLPEDEKTPE
ncbi:cell division protein FtsB [Bacilli bacterium PM5-3]|nr:cell division protein FtsB [Bacilli bacterium PM5-3]MDH6603994.1 cell division protein FtsB [Bacilli bacterium PM5-9]